MITVENKASIANLPTQIQQVLPALVGLSLEQKMVLFHLLTDADTNQTNVLANDDLSIQALEQTTSVTTEPTSQDKPLTPLDRQYFKDVSISDDFDEHLGDIFWSGHEHELV